MDLSSNDNGPGIAVAVVKSGNDNKAGAALLEAKNLKRKDDRTEPHFKPRIASADFVSRGSNL